MTRRGVAPYESCIVCYRGDTTTGCALEGSAEFLIAALLKAGLPRVDATAVVMAHAHDEYGADLGMAPTTGMRMAVRICRDCAAKAGLTIGDVATAPPLYTERPEPELE